MILGQFGAILRFVAARVLRAAATILAVATLVFFGMQAIGGSYADLMFPMATPEQKAELAAHYGFDRSAFVQYLAWLKAAAQGDFGISLTTQKPVLASLMERLPLTLELAGLALALIALIGYPLGVLAGLLHTSRWSQSGRIGATLLMSIPDFVLGSICVWVFSVYSLGLKAGGWVPLSEGLWLNLQTALLPAAVLAVSGLGLLLATARSGVMGVMAQDHILAAVSRGLAPGMILRRHILRNSLIPVLTLFAIIAGYLLGGAVLVETVFTLDGLGRFLANAIARRDYPVVQAGVILIAAIFVILNMVADLLYSIIDPRIVNS